MVDKVYIKVNSFKEAIFLCRLSGDWDGVYDLRHLTPRKILTAMLETEYTIEVLRGFKFIHCVFVDNCLTFAYEHRVLNAEICEEMMRDTR